MITQAIHKLGLLALLFSLSAAAQVGDKKPAHKEPSKPQAPATAPQPDSVANRTDYVIGETDLLVINVWRDQELSRTIPVRPDGKISLPLIGELQASGLTPAALQATITQKLRDYVEHPEVTVIVQEARSQVFNIMGEVLKPGTYPLGQRLTVLDAIALAGDFKEWAKKSKIYVLRTHADGKTERLPFDYKKVLKGDLSQNIFLQPRDTVVVP